MRQLTGEMGFDPYYEKYCDSEGILIISSPDVDGGAFQKAHEMLHHMLAPIPYIRDMLVRTGAYFAAVGRYDGITRLPEYAALDSAYWDRRARGLGGSAGSRITSGPEENLLCLVGEPNYGESISVHEFAHTIHLAGLAVADPGFDVRLLKLYMSAIGEGLWQDTYVMFDVLEYWAEGVQCYFNTNLESVPPDGVHNAVNTRMDLAAYDPGLYRLIDSVFDGLDWTPTCPR